MHQRGCCDALSSVGIELAAHASVLRHQLATSVSFCYAKWIEPTTAHEGLTGDA
jgi:hypothetical protein